MGLLSVITANMQPTYKLQNGTNGASRQTGSGAGTYVTIVGTSFSYTAGASNEVLFILGSSLIQATASGGQMAVFVNGVIAGSTSYADAYANNAFISHMSFAIASVSAGVTVTIDLRYKLGTGTYTIANQSADTTNGYAPQLAMFSFGKP